MNCKRESPAAVAGDEAFGLSSGRMRYLILSDIHANLEALDAVLAEAGADHDEAVCLGDLVGYGPDPNAAVDRVRSLDLAVVIRGNHDKAGCGISDAQDFNLIARQAAGWTRRELTESNLAYLRGLAQGPAFVGGFQLVHGSPRHEDEYLFTLREVGENFQLCPAKLLFFGHTHVQGGFHLDRDAAAGELEPMLGEGAARAKFQLEEGSRYFLNPGSIGQPRDGDPRAAFAFYDDEDRVVEYCRVPYPVEETQKKILAAGLPQPLALRLTAGR